MKLRGRNLSTTNEKAIIVIKPIERLSCHSASSSANSSTLNETEIKEELYGYRSNENGRPREEDTVVEDALKAAQIEICSSKEYIAYLQPQLHKSQVHYLQPSLETNLSQPPDAEEGMSNLQPGRLVDKQIKELLLQIAKYRPNYNVLGQRKELLRESGQLLHRAAKQKNERWYLDLSQIMILREGTKDDEDWWKLWYSLLQYTASYSQLGQGNELFQTGFA